MVRTRTTTNTQLRRPSRLAEYSDGSYLDQILSVKREERSRRKIEERRALKDHTQKRKRGRPRKMTATPIGQSNQSLTSDQNQLIPAPNPSLILAKANQNQKSQSVEINASLLRGVDSWTNQLGEKLNDLGIGFSKTRTPKILQTTLLPSLTTENSGIIWETKMIGARDQEGQIKLPQEFNLSILRPIPSRNQSPILNLEPRIQEIESDEELSNQPPESDLQSDYNFQAQMTSPNQNYPQLNIDAESGELPINPEDEQLLSNQASPNQRNQREQLNRQKRAGQRNQDQPQISNTFGAEILSGTPADNFYNLNQPSTYSAMNISQFNRFNNVVSRHKPFKAKFQRNPIIAPGLYTFLFADTIHAYKRQQDINSGYQYILAVVDALSKQSFVRPLYDNTALECARAFEDICLYLDLPGSPFLVTDQGPEFSPQFDRVAKQLGFQRIRLQGRHKASIAERFM
jgi:hypothetical protein